jgi:hypothetical protein
MKELNETEERTETRIEVALSYTNRVRLRDNQARFVMHNFNIIDEVKYKNMKNMKTLWPCQTAIRTTEHGHQIIGPIRVIFHSE